MVNSYDEWLIEYKKDKYKIWIKIILSNEEERYFCDYKDWALLKKYCKTNTVNISKIGLQYRSNYLGIDTTDCDGVYLVKSLVGLMGAKSRHTYTIGKIKGDIVEKQVFMTPELIQERIRTDSVSSCFEEGLLYHNEKTKII